MVKGNKIYWNSKKFHIIYGPLKNITKIFIKSQRLLLKKTSANFIEEKDQILQLKEEFKKKVKFINLGKKEYTHSSMVQITPLSCIGRRLYD